MQWRSYAVYRGQISRTRFSCVTDTPCPLTSTSPLLPALGSWKPAGGPFRFHIGRSEIMQCLCLSFCDWLLSLAQCPPDSSRCQTRQGFLLPQTEWCVLVDGQGPTASSLTSPSVGTYVGSVSGLLGVLLQWTWEEGGYLLRTQLLWVYLAEWDGAIRERLLLIVWVMSELFPRLHQLNFPTNQAEVPSSPRAGQNLFSCILQFLLLVFGRYYYRKVFTFGIYLFDLFSDAFLLEHGFLLLYCFICWIIICAVLMSSPQKITLCIPIMRKGGNKEYLRWIKPSSSWFIF